MPTTKHAYKCICNKSHNPWVDLGFWGYNKRGLEVYKIRGAPQMVVHVKRVFSSFDIEGRLKVDKKDRVIPPDYIITEKPLASHYLIRTERVINRPIPDTDGRPILGKRRNVPKIIEPKFEEVEWAEVTVMENKDGVNVYELPWTDDLFTELPKNGTYRPDLIRAGVTVSDEQPAMDGGLDGPLADAVAGQAKKRKGRPKKVTANASA